MMMKRVKVIMNMRVMMIANIRNNKGSDNENENSVYWCFDEASEYKGWVIKLDLTTPVKF